MKDIFLYLDFETVFVRCAACWQAHNTITAGHIYKENTHVFVTLQVDDTYVQLKKDLEYLDLKVRRVI